MANSTVALLSCEKKQVRGARQMEGTESMSIREERERGSHRNPRPRHSNEHEHQASAVWIGLRTGTNAQEKESACDSNNTLKPRGIGKYEAEYPLIRGNTTNRNNQ
jgi:hypothetical protein